MNKQIIDDQKKTIERLQKECTEKTNAILLLGQECERTKERLKSFPKDYSKLYQVVENKGYIKELDQLKAENEELKKYLPIVLRLEKDFLNLKE